MLPGLAPLVGNAKAVSLLSSTASTTATIAWPAGIAEGDVAVLFDSGYGPFNGPAAVTPAGFTAILSEAAGQISTCISCKILTGAEAGAITGMAVVTATGKRLHIFRQNVPVSAVTVSTVVTFEDTAADPTVQIIGASGHETPLVVFALLSATGSAPVFTQQIPALDAEETAGTRMRTGYKIYNEAPVSHTVDMGDHGVNALAGFYLLLT